MLFRKNKCTPDEIEALLLSFNNNIHPLQGIRLQETRLLFASLLSEAASRIYPLHQTESSSIQTQDAEQLNIDFDPFDRVAYLLTTGYIHEALWLLFLASYIGWHTETHWALLRGIYNSLGNGPVWTYERVRDNAGEFLIWLRSHYPQLRTVGLFSVHHKHIVMDANKAIKVGETIAAYLSWQANFLLQEKEIFDPLYHSLNNCVRNNKILNFNFLLLLAQAGVISARPLHPYLNDSPEMKRTAKWLIGGSRRAEVGLSTMNYVIGELARYLDISFGIYALRDALLSY